MKYAPTLISNAFCAHSLQLLKPDLRKQYVTRAGGAAAVIEGWGPTRIVSNFDLMIFASHYGPIVCNARCFRLCLDVTNFL